jgi:hypothetical protein
MMINRRLIEEEIYGTGGTELKERHADPVAVVVIQGANTLSKYERGRVEQMLMDRIRFVLRDINVIVGTNTASLRQ